MAYSNVPVNGWPQIKDLEKLDAIAQQIENMPTFTSNDKAFLEDLPAYPDTDGKKVLTATTTSGTTVLSWGNQSAADYSTTEHATGQKWIDGKDVYFQVVDLENDITVGTSWVSIPVLSGERDVCIKASFISSNGNLRMQPSVSFAEQYIRLQYMNGSDSGRYLVIYYTKTESEE